MDERGTVAELFEIAISVEGASERLYRGLEAKFAQEEEVARLWDKFAREEMAHARWLEQLRDGTGQETLAGPADPGILKDAQRMLKLSVEKSLEKIQNLEDAYQLAVELENSEVNAIFDFLVTHFAHDDETRAFLKGQLSGHVARIEAGFPPELRSTVKRKEVAAQG